MKVKKMGKIVLFLPDEDMIEQAMQILRNEEYHVDIIKKVETSHIVEEARQVIAEGAEIIIARGNQAMYIKQNLTIPVVDIRATGQELGLLLTEAKKISEKEYPTVLVIANKNMLPDTTHFGEMYGINLKIYTVSSKRDIRLLVQRIAESNPDVMIGGTNVINAAKSFSIKTVYFSLTQDGLREALRVAKMLKYAMDIEKKSNAQIKALMDNSLTGILRTDRNGRTIFVNELMQNILKRNEKKILGKNLLELIPGLEADRIKMLLESGGFVLSTYMIIGDRSVNLIATPVVVEEVTDGLLLFCCPVRKLHKPVADTERDLILSDDMYTFDGLFHTSEKMQKLVHRARAYISSDGPILITGEPGTEKRQLAQTLYRYCEEKNGPFICVDCASMDEEGQKQEIFGNPGGRGDKASALIRASEGVLLLHNIDFLTRRNQSALLSMLGYQGGTRRNGKPYNFRLLATAEKMEMLENGGNLIAELYYVFSGLVLEIPPLRERPEDFELALHYYFENCREKYSRYFSLTKDAQKYLKGLPWKGNLIELECFCEKMILNSEQRILDLKFVEQLIENAGLYGGDERLEEKRKTEKERIYVLLEKYHGDRKKIAEELGISTVTLWRKMKRYEIK